MTKLFKLLGLNKPVAGEYGIEIECEGKNMVPIDSKTWGCEDDGSLRGAFPESRSEFVLKKPVLYTACEAALDELIGHQVHAEFSFSFRTSVHIHMNVQTLTVTELYNLIYTYLLIEQPLVNYCGDGRKGNRFCLRLRDAEGMMEILTMLFQTGDKHLRRIPADHMRYASINLEAFKKYGSIEFRAMRGTMDKAIILPWIEMLNSIKTYAMGVANPKVVHEDFRALGSVGFLNHVLGPENAARVITPTAEREMNESYSLSIDLPYNYIEPEPVVELDEAGEAAALRAQMRAAAALIRAENAPVAARAAEFDELLQAAAARPGWGAAPGAVPPVWRMGANGAPVRRKPVPAPVEPEPEMYEDGEDDNDD